MARRRRGARPTAPNPDFQPHTAQPREQRQHRKPSDKGDARSQLRRDDRCHVGDSCVRRGQRLLRLRLHPRVAQRQARRRKGPGSSQRAADPGGALRRHARNDIDECRQHVHPDDREHFLLDVALDERWVRRRLRQPASADAPDAVHCFVSCGSAAQQQYIAPAAAKAKRSTTFSR